jgi:ketosteroid isomerase-like protein
MKIRICRKIPGVICIAFLLVAPSWTFAQSPTGTAATDQQKELVQLAQRRFKAFFEGDKTAYEQLVAKDAVFAYSNGRTLNYAEAMSELAPMAKAGTYSFRYEDIQFRDFGDSALLVYRLVFRGPPDGGGDYQGVESDTFRRINKVWKLIAVHGTTIPYPKRVNIEVEHRLLDEYLGRYESAPGVYYDITREGSQLMGQRNGFQKVPWLAESSDIFYVPSDPTASRVFMRDPNGVVSKLVRIDIQGDTEWRRVKVPAAPVN